MNATGAQISDLQHGLSLVGFPAAGGPALTAGVFDVATVAALDAYWSSLGAKLPQTADAALTMLKNSFRSADGATQNPVFSADELFALAKDYAALKGLGASGWFKKNWYWVVIGGVVVAGGAVGGFFWWKKSKKPMGELEGLGDGGMGCPCALGHSGRTSRYTFPTGKKLGHYRDSTGRFHTHP